MMPVPTHLRECVVPKDSAVDESELDATVRCPCGSQEFSLLFPGHTHEYDGETIPCTAEIDGSFFFLIKAVCTSCSKEHLLIDQDFHGWNGFVCHEESQASKPRPPLTPWKCLGCGATPHSATIQIQTEGREDFVEEAGDEFDADRWHDGFGWFSMAIRCGECGKETPQWVSLETM
jgi:hypothetical protein